MARSNVSQKVLDDALALYRASLSAGAPLVQLKDDKGLIKLDKYVIVQPLPYLIFTRTSLD